jgi:hypothetical protein
VGPGFGVLTLALSPPFIPGFSNLDRYPSLGRVVVGGERIV